MILSGENRTRQLTGDRSDECPSLAYLAIHEPIRGGMGGSVYDPDIGTGILRGSDVDWEEHPVAGGVAQGLILNEEEIVWLRKTWTEATGGL